VPIEPPIIARPIASVIALFAKLMTFSCRAAGKTYRQVPMGCGFKHRQDNQRR
jgi:hypothetical protein